MQISDTVQQLEDALSITINQMVYNLKRAGEDVITLSLGEAFFEIPLFDFSQLDIEKIYHYSDSKGIPELRDKIARFYHQQYNAPVEPSEIIITAGSKPAIFMATLAVLNPGDEALIHEPAWLSYPAHVKLAQGVPKFIPYDKGPEAFEEYFTPRTRLLMICNPNNPGGHIYTWAELTAIHRLCLKHDTWLLVDEAYSDFVLGDGFVSAAAIAPDKEGLIIANSLSKNMGMSGWRVGYTISNPIANAAIEKLNQHIITCAPTILTHYMARYFDDVIAHTLPQVRDVVEKRKRTAEFIESIGLRCLSGGATFYFFVNIGDFPASSMDFALEMLLRHNVSVVPGSAYGESTERFVRVSIGAESEDRIRDALVAIKALTLDRTFSAISLHQRFWQSELSKGVAREVIQRGTDAWLRRTA